MVAVSGSGSPASLSSVLNVRTSSSSSSTAGAASAASTISISVEVRCMEWSEMRNQDRLDAILLGTDGDIWASYARFVAWHVARRHEQQQFSTHLQSVSGEFSGAKLSRPLLYHVHIPLPAVPSWGCFVQILFRYFCVCPSGHEILDVWAAQTLSLCAVICQRIMVQVCQSCCPQLVGIK